MISQKCPKCSSGRVRRGYRTTSIFSKIFFRFHLLCDNCNWEFKGFALPFAKGSVNSGAKKRKKIQSQDVETMSVEANVKSRNDSQNVQRMDRQKKIRKKVKIRI